MGDSNLVPDASDSASPPYVGKADQPWKRWNVKNIFHFHIRTHFCGKQALKRYACRIWGCEKWSVSSANGYAVIFICIIWSIFFSFWKCMFFYNFRLTICKRSYKDGYIKESSLTCAVVSALFQGQQFCLCIRIWIMCISVSHQNIGNFIDV